MRKRYRILLAALIVVVIGGLVWMAWPEPPEPVYQGKKLSVWLAIYVTAPENADTNQIARVDDAVRHIGTNALPTLLRLVAAHDSAIKDKCLALLQKQGIIKIVYVDTYQRNVMGLCGLHALGADAKQLVPNLINIYHQTDSFEVKLGVIGVLFSAGPTAKDSVPFLLREMTNDNWVIGREAVRTLAAMHSEPEVTVPALIELLHQTNRFGGYRDDAVQALEKFGPDARLAIPELIRALTNGNPDVDINVRQDLIHALKAIDPAVAAKFEE